MYYLLQKRNKLHTGEYSVCHIIYLKIQITERFTKNSVFNFSINKLNLKINTSNMAYFVSL